MEEMEPERGLLFAVLSFSGRSFEDVEVDELNADGGVIWCAMRWGGVCRTTKGIIESFVLRKAKNIPTSHPEGA